MADLAPYISVTDAGTWLATHITNIAAWTAAAAGQKATALMEASDHLESLPLKGLRYFPLVNQTREFPSFDTGLYQANSDALYLSAYDHSAVPDEVKNACVLEALEILKRDNTQRLDNQEQCVQSQSISGSSETYVSGVNERYHGLLSKRAYDQIKYWIAVSMEAI